ncbi:MAG: histidine kinase N-terminal 7TM domain-containing protein [Halopenitus sp.]
MVWTVSVLSLVVFGGAAVAFAVAIAALRERPDPLAVPLAVMMFAVMLWATLDGVSMGFSDPDRVRFWYRLRYPAIVTAPVAYAVVALTYTGKDRWITRRTLALLAVVPVLTVVIVWTNHLHGIYWESMTVVRAQGVSLVEATPGLWYWVNLGYLYLLTIVTLSTLGGTMLRSSRMYRKQAAIMFVAGLVPLATNAVSIFEFGPDPVVDFTTLALTGTGVLVALAVYQFDLVEVRPVARDRLLEELNDGVIVVGPNGRVREFNPTAAKIFDDLELNKPADEVLTETVAPDGGELVVETDEGTRLYHSRSTQLLDERRDETAQIVYLNDVTEIVQREQRLGVLNRILRHNVRNELNVVRGHLELLEEDGTFEGAEEDGKAEGAEEAGTFEGAEEAGMAEGAEEAGMAEGAEEDGMAEGAEEDGKAEGAEHVETAKESLDRVLTLAEKARDVERTLQVADSSITTSATAALDRVSDAAEAGYPEAEISVVHAFDDGVAVDESTDGTDAAADRDVPIEVVGEELLDMALQELVENAVEHNDREHPSVTLRLEPGDDVRIQVVDDGPPIPEQEIAALGSWGETGLEHGSGLGLWLVHWMTTLSSGDLSFGTRDSRGNVVTLTLPAASE